MPGEHVVILEDDVLRLTRKAEKELGDAETSLSSAELEVLVLIDGRSTAGETAARMTGIEHAGAIDVLCGLLRDGLIEIGKAGDDALDFINFFDSSVSLEPSAAASARAQKAAAATTSLLQQQGYFVRIVRRAPAGKNREQPQKFTILVVEDEPTLAKLMKHVLEAEGFSVRNAMNRDEIVAEMRRPPPPDLVLLDVLLPDVDGFEVLFRIRRHPALKGLPVVMITSEATRGSVLKGLAGGADGYVTKPFDVPVLMKAVGTVLGLSVKNVTDADPWPP